MRWAQRKAAALAVRFSGTPQQIEAMIREGRSQHGDLFLDYGIKGNQLQRPGLDALFRLALADLDITHVFIPRRDRFARPDDPLDAMKMEQAEATATVAPELLIEVEQEQLVRAAIRTLKPRCAEMIRLLFYEQPPLPYAEVARRLGLATGSIGFIRGRCLKQLQKALLESGF